MTAIFKCPLVKIGMTVFREYTSYTSGQIPRSDIGIYNIVLGFSRVYFLLCANLRVLTHANLRVLTHANTGRLRKIKFYFLHHKKIFYNLI